MIDDYGQALVPDLMRYAGIDLLSVVRGDGPPPAVVLSHIAGLPVGSMFVSMRLAEKRGGDWREYVGKDDTWWALADVYDAVNTNTRATGQWKKGKAPKIDPYPRPGDKAKKKPKTLADLHAALAGPAAAVKGDGIWKPVI